MQDKIAQKIQESCCCKKFNVDARTSFIRSDFLIGVSKHSLHYCPCVPSLDLQAGQQFIKLTHSLISLSHSGASLICDTEPQVRCVSGPHNHGRRARQRSWDSWIVVTPVHPSYYCSLPSCY